MERTQTLYALRAELKKWDDKFDTARNEGKRTEKERADARSNEVTSVALLLGFTAAELLGSPFIPGSETDNAWKAEHPQTEQGGKQ